MRDAIEYAELHSFIMSDCHEDATIWAKWKKSRLELKSLSVRFLPESHRVDAVRIQSCDFSRRVVGIADLATSVTVTGCRETFDCSAMVRLRPSFSFFFFNYWRRHFASTGGMRGAFAWYWPCVHGRQRRVRGLHGTLCREILACAMRLG